jgi:hypothetical protein
MDNSNCFAHIDVCTSSKDTKALYLLSIGKTPLDVAIELDLPASQVHEIQQEFWSLNELHELVFAYNEIKYYSSSFLSGDFDAIPRYSSLYAGFNVKKRRLVFMREELTLTSASRPLCGF